MSNQLFPKKTNQTKQVLGLTKQITGRFHLWPVAAENSKLEEFYWKVWREESVMNMNMSIILGWSWYKSWILLMVAKGLPPTWLSWWAVTHFWNEPGLQATVFFPMWCQLGYIMTDFFNLLSNKYLWALTMYKHCSRCGWARRIEFFFSLKNTDHSWLHITRLI